jgi:hypothetical protein
MLYSETITVCSDIHTKHINTLCGQNVEFFVLNMVDDTLCVKRVALEGVSLLV